MKGLALAKEYFKNEAQEIIENSELAEHAAFGLVGEGSECYGFDDELSRDHDWGPAFCIWINDDQYEALASESRRLYEGLPKVYKSFERKNCTDDSASRIGVMKCSDFFKRYTGFVSRPENILHWMYIPENGLSVVTNGEVFMDRSKQFSSIRGSFQKYYPEDIAKQKLAASLAIAAQVGQYNYARCLKRGQIVAALAALSEYIQNIEAIVFNLNKVYMPYYKWSFEAMKNLPVLGTEMASFIQDICQRSIDDGQNMCDIEDLSFMIANHLRESGLCSSSGNYLLDLAMEIKDQIEDPLIRQLHIMQK